ncbi:MAG TPA: type VII secretion protein EccE [Mycolicibacillus parakoreensis]|nr:type VII secretion protein EccE [Mycolicibacillus parakoreensis]
MSMNRPTMVWPGPARLTLVALAVIPAALAYPWPTTRDRWILGVAVAIVILLLAWWRGLHITTLLRRGLAVLSGNRIKRAPADPVTTTTAVLSVTPTEGADGVLPLPLLAGYLDRYGIRADSIQITSRDGDPEQGQRDTWIGLTVAAADNLAALQARSASVPLQETARVAARRLADHLRELGWDAAVAQSEDVPMLIETGGKETWRAVADEQGDYLAAYRISVDGALSETLREVWLQPTKETWTAMQITGTPAEPAVAAACALRTAERPAAAAPLGGLTPQRGIHRAVLAAMDPLSGDRLQGRTEVGVATLAGVPWPLQRPRRAKKKTRGRHATVGG